MAGMSAGGGMSAKGGDSGDATATGGNSTFSFGSTIGGFNVGSAPDKNIKYYVGGALFLALIYILKKK